MANLFEGGKPDEILPHLDNGEIQVEKFDSVSTIDNDSFIQQCDVIKREYLIMINDIHYLLENCKDLSNQQKLEYCNSERYYMKLYLKHVVTKFKKCFPD